MSSKKLLLILCAGLWILNLASQTPNVIILLGSPGAGKSLAQTLHKITGHIHLCGGDLIREEIKKGNESGLILKKFVEKIEKVDLDHINQIIIDLLKNKLELYIKQKQKFILDNFPQNLTQAHFLDSLLQPLDPKDVCFIHLNTDPENAISRMITRQICSQCGLTYNSKTKPSAIVMQCDNCGSKLIVRSDDS